MNENVRNWECSCGHKWTETVKYTENQNLSGEATVWCPKCNKRPLVGSPQYKQQENDNENAGTNLMYAIAKKAMELANKPLNDLRADVGGYENPEAETYHAQIQAAKHLNRGQCIEYILIEEFEYDAKAVDYLIADGD